MEDLELVKYPIGRFQMPGKISDVDILDYIETIKKLPSDLARTIENFNEEKFNSQYRKDGWTVQQVIRHIADSHSIAYVRFKQGMEENNLTAKPYSGEKADFDHIQNDAVKKAVQTIFDVHEKWFSDLNSLSESELKQSFFYPDANRNMPFTQFLAIFAWHSKHHLGHISELKKRSGW